MNTQLEMIYTPFEQSCRYPHLDDDYTIRLCRRMKGHTDYHASDHPYTEWTTHE